MGQFVGPPKSGCIETGTKFGLSMNDCVSVASIRAFLLIENRLLREALVRLLRKRPDIVVAGQSSPSDETSVGILDTQCNVLVSDFFVPGLLPASLSTKIGALAGYKITHSGMDSDEERFIAAVRWG